MTVTKNSKYLVAVMLVMSLSILPSQASAGWFKWAAAALVTVVYPPAGAAMFVVLVTGEVVHYVEVKINGIAKKVKQAVADKLSAARTKLDGLKATVRELRQRVPEATLQQFLQTMQSTNIKFVSDVNNARPLMFNNPVGYFQVVIKASKNRSASIRTLHAENPEAAKLAGALISVEDQEKIVSAIERDILAN